MVLLHDVMGYTSGAAGFNYNTDQFHVNGNNINNNPGCSRGMVLAVQDIFSMKSYHHLYQKVCSYENILLAWKKARKGKTQKQYVIDFEKDIKNNLVLLRIELLLHSYRPKPLENFILRDPKTRIISVSDFRDRVVHHAICNIIEPLFDRTFIYDSYANRKRKGTLAAIKRLEAFQRKVSRNKTAVKKFNKINVHRGFFLKADIKKYFDTVDHKILLEIIKRKIKDQELLFLLRKILANHESKESGKGMPLGNLTSQFLANVYLNELDQFVKKQLKAKYYIRYVDDFIILHNDKYILSCYKEKLEKFLNDNLSLRLNQDKSKIEPLARGVQFLGFRTFYYHKILKKKNTRRIYHKVHSLENDYHSRKISYDKLYDFLEGWCAYARNANTFRLRKNLLGQIEQKFPHEISAKEVNRLQKAIANFY